MRVSGELNDVRKLDKDFLVLIRAHGELISLIFGKLWSNRLLALRKGDPVVATGTLNDADALTVRLINCEFEGEL